ncbi:MAG: glycosyltransferase family 39 protein [Labilithrix sp.]|nr:glycosyltransferase family 39 protein [Labilithrix sp.]
MLRGLVRRVRVASIVSRLGVFAFVGFAIVGLRLPVDVDEGYYALAAELVTHGRAPYADFFYPQGPLYPYLLAPFVLLFGARFLVLRLASSAFAAIAAALVAHLVHRETRSRLAAVAAVVLFATHELSWQWLVTIRPYGLGVALLLGSLVLATPPDREPRPRELFLAGALGVVAPLMRLPFAPAFGVVPLALLLRGTNAGGYRGAIILALVAFGAMSGWHPTTCAIAASIAASIVAAAGPGALAALKRVGAYSVGAAVVALPTALVFARSWDSFAYGLVGYHVDSSSLVTLPENRAYLSSVIGGGAFLELSASGTQTALLLVANAVALTLRGASIRWAGLVGATALALGAARHAPLIEHYLTPVVPYLAVGAAMALGHLDGPSVVGARRKRPAVVATIAASALFVLASSSSLEKKWLAGRHDGWDDRGFRPRVLDQKVAAVVRATRERPGPVLATWPGSALRCAERVMPGYENHFTRLVASKKTAEEAAALHLTSDQDVRAAIERREPRVVVLDREAGIGADRVAFESLVEGAGYVRVETLGDVAVYARD